MVAMIFKPMLSAFFRDISTMAEAPEFRTGGIGCCNRGASVYGFQSRHFFGRQVLSRRLVLVHNNRITLLLGNLELHQLFTDLELAFLEGLETTSDGS